MEPDTSMIEPKDGAQAPSIMAPDASQSTGVEPQAPETAPGALPENILKIPAMQGLMAGNPAAVSAAIKEFQKRGEAKLLIDNKDLLTRAGMGFYRSISGDLGVIFNQLHIHPDAIQAADKAGQLLSIAPPFDKVNHELSKAGAAHPVLNAQVPSGPASAPVPAPIQSATMPLPPPPASAQRKLMGARLANVSPGAPTSGPVAGQGALLRSILKPVV